MIVRAEDVRLRLAGIAVILSLPKCGPILVYIQYFGVAHCKIGAAGGVGRFSNSTLSKYSLLGSSGALPTPEFGTPGPLPLIPAGPHLAAGFRAWSVHCTVVAHHLSLPHVHFDHGAVCFSRPPEQSSIESSSFRIALGQPLHCIRWFRPRTKDLKFTSMAHMKPKHLGMTLAFHFAMGKASCRITLAI